VCRVIWRRAAAAVACVLSGLAVAALAARATRRRPPAGQGRIASLPVQAAALTPVATAGSVAAVALAAPAAWWLAGLLAVPAAVAVAGQLPRQRRPGHGTAGQGQAGEPRADFRVLTVNVQRGQGDPDAIVAAVARHEPDVLAIEELTEDLAGRLKEAGITALLPYDHTEPRPRSAGAGLWSRWPLEPLPPLPGLRHPAPCARVTPAAGPPVTVRAVHVVAPLKGRQREWHEELRRLGLGLRGVAGPQVVAGDFNASRDHRPFRDLLAVSGFADCGDIARDPSWPGLTWPSDRRWLPPVMRLDHVLVSPGLTARQVRTVAVPGTDHMGVLAVIELAGTG
jgi:endonuclease/exonuclease/phosphatase family metal-dependent hydrolase